MEKQRIGLSLDTNFTRFGFIIQFKAKTPNDILLIPTLAFTPYVTSPNVLDLSLLRFRINDQNYDVMNDQSCTLCLDA